MTATKEDLRKVISCATLFHDNLENKTLLFLCLDKHNKIVPFSCNFFAENFLHLTGVTIKPNSNAVDFYHKCLNHKLSLNDFEMNKHAHQKITVLPSMLNGHLAASMIGDYNETGCKLRTDKLVGNIRAFMGFIFAADKGAFIPNTVFEDDLRDNVLHPYYRVIATFRKNMNEEIFSESTYVSPKVNLTDLELPKQYQYLLTLI